MAFDYSLEEMIVVKAPSVVLDTAAEAEGIYWNCRIIGFPQHSRKELLLRPIGRRPKRWDHTQGPIENVEESLRQDDRVESFRRVHVIMVRRQPETASNTTAPTMRPRRHNGTSITPQQEQVLMRDSIHGKWECGRNECFTYESAEAAQNALREAGATNTVLNSEGQEIDFDAALEAMDTDLVDEIHDAGAGLTKQEFFEEYCEAHRDKFGEEFELNKRITAE